MPDHFRDLRNYGVSKSFQSGSVQSSGNPIICSTNRGFSEDEPTAACIVWSRRSRSRERQLLRVNAAGLLPLCIVAVGVGGMAQPDRPRLLDLPSGNLARTVPLTVTNVSVATFARRVSISSLAAGVGNNPDPVPPVRGVDGTSRNNKRAAGVAECFQVRKHIVEAHADVPSNILSNDPSGPEFTDKAAILRPEVAVIFLAPSLPGGGERLAWISAANNVNWANVTSIQFAHVSVNSNSWPMLRQHPSRELLNLAECHSFEAARHLQP